MLTTLLQIIGICVFAFFVEMPLMTSLNKTVTAKPKSAWLLPAVKIVPYLVVMALTAIVF